jgi:hypothetical protein
LAFSSFIEFDKSDQYQKGAAMNTRIPTDVWTYRIALVLSLMLATSLAGILVLTLIEQPVPDLLFVVGAIAASGLALLLIPSPL